MSLRSTSSGAETTTVPSASLSDLDLERFDAWLQENARRLAADDVTHEDALLQLRLAGTMGSRIVPTVAGLYVFGHEPQFTMPQLTVVIAQFEGTDITADLIERDALSGPLPDLVEGALEFVGAAARQLVNQVEPSQSTLEFPRRVVREAIVNALIHRDLRAGGPVALRMFEDRLEVWSPGPPNGLPEPIERYLSKGGVSLPPNPLVALFARQLGLADQLGRGLPLMRRLVEEEVHGKLSVVGSKDGVLVSIPSAIVAGMSRTDLLAN